MLDVTVGEEMLDKELLTTQLFVLPDRCDSTRSDGDESW